MDNLAVLGSLASELHREFQALFYVTLPVFFMLALVLAWFRNPMGSPEFLDVLKRAVVASLLLAAFPEIANSIRAVTDAVAAKISDMNGLETYLRMTREKAGEHAANQTSLSLVWAFNDIFVATLSYLSYLILYFARYFMVAVYQFTWLLLTILSPLLLLFHLFTSKITLNLFRTLIEVASWQIIWAVLSVMLDSLPYGNFLQVDGQHFTLIIMNFVVALALFLTPVIVKSLVGGSFSAMATSLGPLAATTMVSLPVKGATLVAKGRDVLSASTSYLKTQQGQARAINPLGRAPVGDFGRNSLALSRSSKPQDSIPADPNNKKG